MQDKKYIEMMSSRKTNYEEETSTETEQQQASPYYQADTINSMRLNTLYVDDEKEVKDRLRKAIQQSISDGFTTFISGMARGIDMWAAEIVIEEREKNNSIKLICASPFEGFEKSWGFDEKQRYNKILKNADYIKYVCSHYSLQCFQIRNVWMVEHSARVIAAYNGESGGTRNTVRYATRKGIEIYNILEASNT